MTGAKLTGSLALEDDSEEPPQATKAQDKSSKLNFFTINPFYIKLINNQKALKHCI